MSVGWLLASLGEGVVGVRRRRHLAPDLGGMLVFLLAFLIMGYCGLSLMRFLAAPVESALVSVLGRSTRPQLVLATPVVVSPTPVPTAEPTPVAPLPTASASGPGYVRVTNTEGLGVYVRRTPQIGDRMRAWPDNSLFEVIEDSIESEGLTWYKVKDPAGNVGFVPSRYVVATRP